MLAMWSTHRLGNVRVAFTVMAPTLAATCFYSRGSSPAEAESSHEAKPCIAVVATGNSAAFDRMPAPLRARAELIRVDCSSPEVIAAQAPLLAKATGLLYIPTTGNPSGGTPSTTLAQVWTHLPNVAWVHTFSAGVETVMPFARDHLAAGPTNSRGDCCLPVPLTNGRGAFSSSLAEHALAGMLHFNKQLPRCTANRTAKAWDPFVMDTMAGKTVGLVGYGSIGQSCGRAAKGAFGCRVIALRSSPCGGGGGSITGPADEVFSSCDAAAKRAFFEACDFVVCSLPLTEATRGIVGKAELAAMKPSAVLVSLGRGATLDEDALADALAAKRIRGAVLDVFTVEPLPASSRLWGLDNVLLTAHNADLTEDYFELGWAVWGENLDRFVKGQPLATPVDLAKGY